MDLPEEPLAQKVDPVQWSRDLAPTWRPLNELLVDSDPDLVTTARKERDKALGTVFREAYEEGIRHSKSTVAAIMERYHQAIAQLDVLREQILEETREDLIALSLKIAEEVILANPAACEEFTMQMVSHALEQFPQADHIRLRVSPTDYVALCEKHSEVLQGRSVEVVEDTTLRLGGAIAECHLGRMDGSAEVRLREVAQVLLQGIRSTQRSSANDAPTACDAEGAESEASKVAS